MRFDDLHLIEPVLRAVRAEGYETPTPIQLKAIPHVLAGKDLLGCAQTGTGKTAAYALPIICRLVNAPGATHDAGPAPKTPHAPASRDAHSRGRSTGPRRPIRVLVLAPTRELAVQINESFQTYGRHTGLKTGVVYGGVGQLGQTRTLQAGIDILVATPGRLLDLMNQGYVDLKSIAVFVLDEADRMLDMGFIHDIRKVIATIPAQRQTLMFSATMPREIQHLADKILRNPTKVEVAPESTTADRVEQSVYFVEKRAKQALLQHLLQADGSIVRALVFTRTKHGADRLTSHLWRANIKAEAIHGNKSQNNRQRALANFKKGSTRVLVATDIAARGLDIDEISHVVNYDLPNEPESYVHRIGRTARAGAAGIAISFCDGEERGCLKDIEKVIRARLPVVEKPVGLVIPEHSAPAHHARGQRPTPPDRGAPAQRGGNGRADSHHVSPHHGNSRRRTGTGTGAGAKAGRRG